MKCEHCEKDKEDVKPRPSMTAYSWDGEGEDPNRDVVICDECWAEHEAYWNQMWDEYHRGVL